VATSSRNVKQVGSTFLRQIAEVAPNPDTTAAARAGADASRRGVIAASSIVTVPDLPPVDAGEMIRPGEEWGSPTASPPDLEVSGGDDATGTCRGPARPGALIRFRAEPDE